MQCLIVGIIGTCFFDIDLPSSECEAVSLFEALRAGIGFAQLTYGTRRGVAYEVKATWRRLSCVPVACGNDARTVADAGLTAHVGLGISTSRVG